jgi:hypothetical protein
MRLADRLHACVPLSECGVAVAAFATPCWHSCRCKGVTCTPHPQHTGLPAPDVVYFLDLAVEEAMKRGQFGEERYEKEAMQRAVRSNFHRLRQSNWKVVDARQSVEEMHQFLCVVLFFARVRVDVCARGTRACRCVRMCASPPPTYTFPLLSAASKTRRR